MSYPITHQPFAPDYSAPQAGFAPKQTFGQGPSGLDVLRKMTEITVKGRSGDGCNWSKYDLYEVESQVLFTSRQDSKSTDCSCKNAMTIMDEMSGQELFRLVVPGNCCLQRMEVYSAADDQLLGTVEQEWAWTYQFVVKDQHGGSAFRIGGGDCCWELKCSSTSIRVTSIDGGSGTPGDVTMNKLETGCCDCWQNAYSLGLPWELDNGLKATFVGAVILLDLVLQDNNGG